MTDILRFEFPSRPRWRWVFLALAVYFLYDVLHEGFSALGIIMAAALGLIFAWYATFREAIDLDSRGLRIQRSALGFKWNQLVEWESVSGCRAEREPALGDSPIGIRTPLRLLTTGLRGIVLDTTQGPVRFGPMVEAEHAQPILEAVLARTETRQERMPDSAPEWAEPAD